MGVQSTEQSVGIIVGAFGPNITIYHKERKITMAIGSLSSTTSSSIGNSSIRGFGGLASGLDRDELIEQMTYGTSSKITQQQQKKTQLQWKQEAIRGISSKMISFMNKYTSSITASTNLFNSNFWGRNKITTTGANSKYVSVSGRAMSSNAFSILGVKQLAQKAKLTSASGVSTGKVMATGVIDDDPDKKYDVENLVGKSISFEYGAESYSIYLRDKASDGTELKYDTVENIEKSIKKLLEDEDSSGKLAKAVNVHIGADKRISFTCNDSNKFEITGGSALEYFGISENDDGTYGNVGVIDEDKLISKKSFTEMLDGKTMTFNYNGKSQTIKLEGVTDFDSLKTTLQSELDKAFGKGRIKVDQAADGTKSLTFKTTNPKGGDDPSSTLSITSADRGLLGKNGVLQANEGLSNRVNLDAKLKESGLNLEKIIGADGTGALYVTDDGKLTTQESPGAKKIEITADDTLNTLMNKINENTNITMSYSAATDKFSITSKENGASGKVELDADVAAAFGFDTTNLTAEGEDAVIAIKYEGSDDVITLTRDSNSFEVDGLTVSLKGKFGYKADDPDKLDEGAEAVEISATVDADKVVDNIKAMVEEYNAIVELVNSELSTKHDRDFAPLTSDQKKELSEDEIKNYEEEAKKGLLFGDSDLRMLSSELRTVISSGLQEEFRKIGISTSNSYSDNGKIELDEEKLRSALATDPENVEKLFTSTAGTNADGTTSYNGLATNLKDVMYKYANPLGSSESKGVLVRKAGTPSSPLSLTENDIYNQISSIDKMIKTLQDRLENERDRYISQFTSLETLISQMNNQSSWLSQFGG